MQIESRLRIRVNRDLKTLPNTWFVKTQETSKRGIPDYILCVNGHFVGLELKSELGKASPLQKWTLLQIAKAGGRAFISYPELWEKIFSIIKEIAHGKNYKTIKKGSKDGGLCDETQKRMSN